MFIPIYGFNVVVSAAIAAVDTILDLGAVANNRLTTDLATPGDYTRLIITDGVRYEVIRVELVAGQLVMTRAQEGTTAIGVPVGACVKFDWTTANMQDFVAQYSSQNFCGITSSNLTVTPNGCEFDISKPDCAGATWRAGNEQFTQDAAGCISAAPAAPAIVDGVYENATITVQGGVVVAVTAGSNVTYGGCPEC